MTGPPGGFSTATLSDALDRLGIEGQALGIRPLDAGFRLTGRAFTVRLVPTAGRGGTVGDFIDDVEPGAVVVLDNGGRVDASVWGDLLTTMAVRRALAGTVINGVCRDTARIIELGYPVFSLGAFMRTGKDRVRAESVGQVVSLGSASVAPGDLVVGDADGVVVVPREHEPALFAAAPEIDARENRIRRAILEGAGLKVAREAVGYHSLQRRAETP